MTTHKLLPNKPTNEALLTLKLSILHLYSEMNKVQLLEIDHAIEQIYADLYQAISEIGQEPIGEACDRKGYAYLWEDLPVGTKLYTNQQPIRNLALIWAQGYRAGISDERESEANIGIAGGDYKVEPNRKNPYENIYPQPKQSEQVELKRDPLSEDKIREICSKVSKESGFDLSTATFVLAFRAAEKEYGIGVE